MTTNADSCSAALVRHVAEPRRARARPRDPGRGQHLRQRGRRHLLGQGQRHPAAARPSRGSFVRLHIDASVRHRRPGAAAATPTSRRRWTPPRSMPRDARRPSVETVLHALALNEMGAQFVAHTHPVAVNAIMCSVAAEEAFARAALSRRDRGLRPGARPMCPTPTPALSWRAPCGACCDSYADEYGMPPKVVLMQNHGLIALGGSAQEVDNITAMYVKTCRVLAGHLCLWRAAFPDAEQRRPHPHAPRRGVSPARAQAELGQSEERHIVTMRQDRRPIAAPRGEPAGALLAVAALWRRAWRTWAATASRSRCRCRLPGPDELLVRHDAVGLCFSDTKVIKAGEHAPAPATAATCRTNPVVLGHEVALTVWPVGENLQGAFPVRRALYHAGRHLLPRRGPGLRLCAAGRPLAVQPGGRGGPGRRRGLLPAARKPRDRLCPGGADRAVGLRGGLLRHRLSRAAGSPAARCSSPPAPQREPTSRLGAPYRGRPAAGQGHHPAA